MNTALTHNTVAWTMLLLFVCVLVLAILLVVFSQSSSDGTMIQWENNRNTTKECITKESIYSSHLMDPIPRIVRPPVPNSPFGIVMVYNRENTTIPTTEHKVEVWYSVGQEPDINPTPNVSFHCIEVDIPLISYQDPRLMAMILCHFDTFVFVDRGALEPLDVGSLTQPLSRINDSTIFINKTETMVRALWVTYKIIEYSVSATQYSVSAGEKDLFSVLIETYEKIQLAIH